MFKSPPPSQHGTQQGGFASPSLSLPNNLVCFPSLPLQDTLAAASPSSQSFTLAESAERINDLAHEDEFARLVCTFQSRALYCSL